MTAKLIMLFSALLLFVSGIFYWYYKDSQDTIKILQENNATLNIASQLVDDTNRELISVQIRQNSINSNLNASLANSRQENKILEQKLAEHELAFLAISRPGLVQGVVNRASNKATRCFEIISGAPLTNAERNATNAQSFNSECPSLYSSTR